MSSHLLCNFPGCGAAVQEFAWITSCSHVFCNEHGQLEFSSRRRESKCPLCLWLYSLQQRNPRTELTRGMAVGSTELPGQLDVVKTEISPSEQYKSMVLAGQKPEVVVEIASRALALWNYQMQLMFSREKQERLAMDKKAQEAIAKLLQEKAALELDLKNADLENAELQKKNSDLDNILAEKTRQNLKLSAAYDALRCRLTEQDASRQLVTPSRPLLEEPHNQRPHPMQGKTNSRSEYFAFDASNTYTHPPSRATIMNRNMLQSRQQIDLVPLDKDAEQDSLASHATSTNAECPSGPRYTALQPEFLGETRI